MIDISAEGFSLGLHLSSAHVKGIDVRAVLLVPAIKRIVAMKCSFYSVLC